MEFLHPGSLWLLLLGLVPVALYLVRRRSRKVRVSTLVFFKTLAREHTDSAWLRRLKRWLSLALTLAMLGLAIFVLARFVVKQDEAGQHRTIVVLLDRSASMELRAADGRTRLDEAKEILRERLKKVPEEVGVALVAYDQRADVVQPRTTKRRELLSRLDDVALRPIAGRPDLAMETAVLLAGLEPPAAIWHFSDRLLPAPPGEIPLHQLNLALPEVKNVGITAVQLRGVPLEHARYDVFVRVALNRGAPAPAQLRLHATVGGIPSQVREIELAPGGESGLTLRLQGSRDQVLRLSLEADRDDFPLDNEVVMPLPEIRPVVAAWIRPDAGEDPYTRLALSSIQESGAFDLLKGGPGAWPLSENVDVVIFDSWLPEEWPRGLPAIVLNPPDAVGPLSIRRLAAAIPYDTVRTGNAEHPVLFRVAGSRVALAQTALFESRVALDPLWFAGDDPVLAAGEIEGGRVVVMGFSPGLSERLPLTASFPILMGNSLYWCVDRGRGGGGGRPHRTGELVRVDGPELRWTGPGRRNGAKVRIPAGTGLVEIDRTGLWETPGGQRGGAALLSPDESDLPARGDGDRGDETYFATEGGFAGNVRFWLLSALLGVLLLESWLFHRHAVY